ADPYHGPTFRELGLLFARGEEEQDRERALKCLAKAISLCPLDARAGEAFSRLCLQTARTEEAKRVWETVTSSHVAAAWAWQWRALERLQAPTQEAGSDEMAVIYAQSALRARPMDKRAWACLGRAYARLGKTASAFRAFSRAHELKADVALELGRAQ
ncbi:hypothetical protein VYU27_010671, partial [Nannochloropsis oceanica]